MNATNQSSPRPFGFVGVLVALLLAGGLALPASSHAQLLEAAPPEEGDSGGADDGGDAMSDEAPDSPWIGGGFTLLANDGTLPGMRVEFGLPVSDRFPIALVFPLTFHGRKETAFGASVKSRLLTILPAVQYEYVLPIEMPGMLSIVGELGFGFTLVRSKISNGIGGSSSDTSAGAGLRAALYARYYFETVPQLFLSLMPGGVTALFNDNSTAFYEFMVGAGYRF